MRIKIPSIIIFMFDSTINYNFDNIYSMTVSAYISW